MSKNKVWYRMYISDLDKLNLVKLGCVFSLEPIFATDPAASKVVKSDSKIIII